MSLHKLTTVIMTGLLAGAALAADPPNGTKPPEESAAAQMQRAMQRLRIVPLDGQINCTLNYRGLAVEIAAPDTPKRSIWIHAMGPGQSITNLGRRCMVVTLRDPDLQVDGQGVYVLIRDDAKLFTSTPAARKACG